MLYNTGTIAISGNTLTGTGTNFTAAGSLIRNGCTVIAMTSPVQVFQITAIGSATSLTVTPAANPAVPAGTRFAILLSDSLSVDGLAQDIAETFTMYQRYMSGFADVMNGTSDVTITINGTAVTVPGQKSLAKKGANNDITSLSGLTTALSISQGGTGDKTASGARVNLGAAASGNNSDINRMTAIDAPLTTSLGGPAGGLVTQKTTNATSNSFACKPFVARFGTGTYTLNAAFGGYMHSSGQAANSGALISVSDDGTFGSYWYFIQGGSVIQTSNGTITPAVSDIRVKNEKKVISEEEAVSFIQDWESILYTLKWSPDKVRAGFRAQDILARNEELIELQELNDGEGGIIEDGMIVDVAEVASAYLVPVVRQLLRRVAELEGKLRAF